MEGSKKESAPVQTALEADEKRQAQVQVKTQDNNNGSTHSDSENDNDNDLEAQQLSSDSGRSKDETHELQDQTNLLPFKQLLVVFGGLSCALFCMSFIPVSQHGINKF